MTSGSVEIREMTADDIPALLEIERESFPVPWSAGMFLEQIMLADRYENLVAVGTGGIIGYIASWYGYEEIHVLSLAVRANERGGGAAAVLLEESLARGRASGCRKAVLEVRVGNSRAIKFYEKNGFTQVGRRRRYYSDSGEDALILERFLDGEAE